MQEEAQQASADQTVAPEHKPSTEQTSSNLGGCLIFGLAGALGTLGLIIFLPSHLSLVSPDEQRRSAALRQIGAVNRAQ
jgi:hypothetical protein